ncbi:MAG: hypothetical protein K5764_10440 [Prevotella sp.]|nr:hypothetical protein [Prevotella sp.]
MRKQIMLLVGAAMALTARGQVTAESYRLSDERQLWQQTGEAAGMAFDFATTDSSANRGVAFFDLQHVGGSYHRIQDGEINNHLRFFTERYQKIGKWLYGYGAFDFNMERTKERAWSDVIRSYESDPFISGSSVYGDYDHQQFTLDARLATVRLGHFTYGAAIRYEVGDLSRLRDPRSRINLLDYRLTPSVTYTFGDAESNSPRHTLGLAVHYDRRKEKLPSLTTVQTDPNLQYYVMTGLEAATGTIGGYQGYMREYVNHEGGAALSYNYASQGLSSLTTVTLKRGIEYVYGTNKYEPGRYHTYHYGLQTYNRLQQGRLLHRIDATVSYQQAYADEYRQERISKTDSLTGYTSVSWRTTMEYRKRFQLKTLDLDLHYRLSFTDATQQRLRGYVGAAYLLHDVRSKRLLPVSSFDNAAHRVTLEGGYVIPSMKDNGDSRLLIDASIGYNIAAKSELDLANATTDFAQAVLLPDQQLLSANYFRGHLQIEYQQPTTISGKKTQWFARAYGDYTGAQHSLYRTQIGCSLGLYY